MSVFNIKELTSYSCLTLIKTFKIQQNIPKKPKRRYLINPIRLNNKSLSTKHAGHGELILYNARGKIIRRFSPRKRTIQPNYFFSKQNKTSNIKIFNSRGELIQIIYHGPRYNGITIYEGKNEKSLNFRKSISLASNNSGITLYE